MNTVVHDNEPPRRGGVLGEGVPGVEQDGDVMVPVQKDERFLAQHYEHRVAQLRQLGEDEHPRPEAWHFILLDEAGIEEKGSVKFNVNVSLKYSEHVMRKIVWELSH